jgi:hypothetical protein
MLLRLGCAITQAPEPMDSDATTTARDGTPVLALTRIEALEPDVGDRQEQGWMEREES